MDGIYEGLYCVTGGSKYKFGILYKQFFDLFKIIKGNVVTIESTTDFDNVNNTPSYSIDVGRTFMSDCRHLNANTLTVIFFLCGTYYAGRNMFAFDRDTMTRLAFLMESCDVSDTIRDLFHQTIYSENYLLNCSHVLSADGKISAFITKADLYQALKPYHPVLFNRPTCTYRENFHLNILYWLEETAGSEHAMHNKALRIEIVTDESIDFRTNQVDPTNNVKQIFMQLIHNKFNNKIINNTTIAMRWRPTDEAIGMYIYNELSKYLMNLRNVIVHTQTTSYTFSYTNEHYNDFQQSLGYELKGVIGEL